MLVIGKEIYMNLIMPMAGSGSRFVSEGYLLPKPLLPLFGKPFFYWATNSVLAHAAVSNMVFIVLKRHVEEHHIDAWIRDYYPSAIIVVIDEVLCGPSLSVRAAMDYIDGDKPILVNDCDHAFECSRLFEDMAKHTPFFSDGEGGAIVTFESLLPRYSYAKFNPQGEVVGTVEKEVVSGRAICGAYLFSSANQYRGLLDSYSESCDYDELFISGLFNEIIRKKMSVLEYGVDSHVSFGTPEEYRDVLERFSSDQFSTRYGG